GKVTAVSPTLRGRRPSIMARREVLATRSGSRPDRGTLRSSQKKGCRDVRGARRARRPPGCGTGAEPPQRLDLERVVVRPLAAPEDGRQLLGLLGAEARRHDDAHALEQLHDPCGPSRTG